MKTFSRYLLGGSALLFSSLLFAATVTVSVYKVAPTGYGDSIGVVTFADSKQGLLITPHLHGLTPGIHGFHIHQNPNCSDNGLAAGGHFDPANTGKHRGPYNNNGHLGDLPALTVTANADGIADLPTLAPNLTVANLKGHSVIIHADGDNYSDQPKPLGGGGARVACGVIQ